MSAEKSASAGPRSSPPDDDSHTIPEDAPPSYSGPLEAGPSTPRANIPRPISRCFDTTPGIIPFDYSQYLPPGSSLSSDHVTITLSAPDLLSNPFALTKFVTAQLALPPRPQVRIIGEHVEGGGKKIDFDLRLNMQRYILSPADAWNYVMIDPIEITKKTKLPPGISVESSEASIAAWARKFCKDRTDNKSYVHYHTFSPERILTISQIHNHTHSLQLEHFPPRRASPLSPRLSEIPRPHLHHLSQHPLHRNHLPTFNFLLAPRLTCQRRCALF